VRTLSAFIYFALVAGVACLGFAGIEYLRDTTEGTPLVTSAAELADNVGKRVTIEAEVESTGVHAWLDHPITYSRGLDAREWYLHLIRFEDTTVALLSNHETLANTQVIRGEVWLRSDEPVTDALLTRYHSTTRGEEVQYPGGFSMEVTSRYSVLYSNPDAAMRMFWIGVIAIIATGILAGIKLLLKRRPKATDKNGPHPLGPIT
jgi:hypothetical protein